MVVVDVAVSPELSPGDLSSVRIPNPDPGVVSTSGQEWLAGVVAHCPDWGGVNTLEINLVWRGTQQIIYFLWSKYLAATLQF